MLREFSGDLSRVMLFLRNITKISILEWRDGSDAPTLLDEASISNLTTEIQGKRSLRFASFGSENSESQLFSTEGMLVLHGSMYVGIVSQLIYVFVVLQASHATTYWTSRFVMFLTGKQKT